MIFPGTGNRIVWTSPGPQTGDVYYRTEDGRVWASTMDTSPRTGVSFGYVDGDKILPTLYPRAPHIEPKPRKPEKAQNRTLDLRAERAKWRCKGS